MGRDVEVEERMGKEEEDDDYDCKRRIDGERGRESAWWG